MLLNIKKNTFEIKINYLAWNKYYIKIFNNYDFSNIKKLNF